MNWTLEVVVIPVTDVDRAKKFYSEQVGFNIDVDRDTGNGFRVVQLTPPGSNCSVTLGPLVVEKMPAETAQLQLCVVDIKSAHSQLLERGVGVSEITQFGDGGPFSTFFFFKDPDGNNWAVQEVPVDRPLRDDERPGWETAPS